MEEFRFRGKASPEWPDKGTVIRHAPSNIALVKYWGKRDGQLPANPSVSFTLDACRTRTELKYRKGAAAGEPPTFTVYFEGEERSDFAPKIRQFLDRILPYQPFLSGLELEIRTENSFPHSSGIASSASGMAALALCLAELERELTPGMQDADVRKKASFLARLGSGSAARSTYGGLVLWGKDPRFPGSSDAFGIPYPLEVHPVYTDFHDTVLLVDSGQKAVSSSVGHNLMHGHPYASARFRQASDNLGKLKAVLAGGDLNAFADRVESEALSLHAMMQTSDPAYLLMLPETLAIIRAIRAYRQSSGNPVCFTLDAGANVHVLYPASAAIPVYRFIREALLPYCPEGRHICDRVGPGPAW